MEDWKKHVSFDFAVYYLSKEIMCVIMLEKSKNSMKILWSAPGLNTISRWGKFATCLHYRDMQAKEKYTFQSIICVILVRNFFIISNTIIMQLNACF